MEEFEDKKISEFMKAIKTYFEPIKNLINFDGIEDYLYADLVGNVDYEEDMTMDYILTLTDFMYDSQCKTKEETVKILDIIKKYFENSLKETKLTLELLDKRIAQLNI